MKTKNLLNKKITQWLLLVAMLVGCSADALAEYKVVVHFAPQDSWAGNHSVRTNYNRNEYGDWWGQNDMGKSKKTYQGRYIYDGEVWDGDGYGGLSALQFQYEEYGWKGTINSINGWTSQSTYKDKLYSNSSSGSWVNYEPDAIHILNGDWGYYDLEDGSVTINLTAGEHDMEIRCGGTYMKNNGTMERTNCTNWEFKSSESRGKIYADIAGNYTFTVTNLSGNPKLSVTYPEIPDYYLKHPWNGGEWSWKKMTRQEGSIYTLSGDEVIWGNNGCNYNTKADGDGQDWIGKDDITGSGSVSNGQKVKFTFDSSDNSLSVESACTPTNYYLGGFLNMDSVTTHNDAWKLTSFTPDNDAEFAYRGVFYFTQTNQGSEYPIILSDCDKFYNPDTKDKYLAYGVKDENQVFLTISETYGNKCEIKGITVEDLYTFVFTKRKNEDRYRITFDYPHIAGTFNGWSPDNTGMSSGDDHMSSDGSYRLRYSKIYIDNGDTIRFKITNGGWKGNFGGSDWGLSDYDSIQSILSPGITVDKENKDNNVVLTNKSGQKVTAFIYFDKDQKIFVDAQIPCTTPDVDDFSWTSSVTYDGTAKSANVAWKSGTGSGAITTYYEGTSGTSYTKSTDKPTNAGTYSLTIDVVAAGNYCAATGISLGNFVINKADQSALTFSGSTQCVGTSVTLSATGGSSGQTITYAKKSGEGTVSGTTLTTSTAGNVVVTATCPGGTNYNDVTADATFTFTAKPTAYAVSGTTSICTGSSTNVTLAGSQSGYTYKLYKNGSATDTTKDGTGSALNFSVNTAGTYTIKGYVTGNESCTTDMSGSAEITIKNAVVTTSPELNNIHPYEVVTLNASKAVTWAIVSAPTGVNIGKNAYFPWEDDEQHTNSIRFKGAKGTSGGYSLKATADGCDTYINFEIKSDSEVCN